jgi:hypothetical protein
MPRKGTETRPTVPRSIHFPAGAWKHLERAKAEGRPLYAVLRAAVMPWINKEADRHEGRGLRLAKAKVAGSNCSNPVFCSNEKGPDSEDFASGPGRSVLGFRTGWHTMGTRRTSTGGGIDFSVSLGSRSSGARRSSLAKWP